MKPVPIADYLDHIGRPPVEKPSPRRETSPFRPRSLQSLQSLQSHEPRPLPVFDRAPPKVAVAAKPGTEEASEPRALLARRPVPIEAPARDSMVAREAAKAEEMALRLAEAHARGREQGFVEGRAEAEEQRVAERAAAQEQAVMERLEFQLNEYAQLEAAMRSGFTQVEENVGAAVARILAPFLVKQVVKYVADELCKSIGRLCAGGAPGLITIRGPERVLHLLRERIADLPAEVRYVEDDGVEAVVEAGATQIVTELRPWAELLASLDT
jgi:hypothetical protein